MDEQVTSADGTRIAFERLGAGKTIIVVAGALQGGATYHPTAVALARNSTVLNYDRRGRGASGDTAPYAIEREVEDIAALIEAAGGTAALYGHSSGAALVLHAAARGLPVDRIVLHEAPFGSGSAEERRAEMDEAEQIRALLAQGRRREVVDLFLSSTGMPPEIVEQLAHDPALLAHAPTVIYDYALTGADSRDGRTPEQQAEGVSVPALVLAGGASPAWMIDINRRIADALPAGRLLVLPGHEHVVPPDVLADALVEFLA
ncbi:alpha/beta fold hydrolase [Antrihabitans sp. YC2-6]|uniref:alpha/beta fold hydrolase n=1 Tax=Antrihabitans sp. YC2-6 TaxID=2799498 RepID=UPI0018F7C37D|nr:alpha/beta hydrolase [Antrihabitans sp. YC2-6]MBJ8344900.1 alpha/beta fold hydrolase [Antrihabitans sp. YC2-6]